MRSRFLIGLSAAALLVFVTFGLGMQAGAQSGYGAGWWGPGMMMGRGAWMGPGMMGGYGYGMGPWMMSPMAGFAYGRSPGMIGLSWYGSPSALNLSVQDVRSYFEGWLAWQGNPRVKLGPVSEKDADTITVDILTTDKDGLVERFTVNRHTGLSQPSGE
jgi:hypothetical protein